MIAYIPQDGADEELFKICLDYWHALASDLYGTERQFSSGGTLNSMGSLGGMMGTGLGDFGMAALAPLVADIDNFVGFKYTYEDFYDLSQVAGFEDAASGGRRFEVFFGRDEMMTAGLAAPIDGFVGSTYNFASPIYAALLRAHETGDDAEASVLMADAQVRKDAVHKEARHAGKAKYAQP